MTCRAVLAPIIAEVIACTGRKDMKALRKALAEAYPYGERANHPYKVWLSEIRRQLGRPLNRPKRDPANPQLELFKP